MFQEAIAASFAIPESQDVTDTAQFITWFRAVTKDLDIIEEMLALNQGHWSLHIGTNCAIARSRPFLKNFSRSTATLFCTLKFVSSAVAKFWDASSASFRGSIFQYRQTTILSWQTCISWPQLRRNWTSWTWNCRASKKTFSMQE